MTRATGQPWAVPTATRPLAATVRLPGSKSITNRALLLAALADGPSTIHRPLRARDTDLMTGALRALGTRITVSPSATAAETAGPARPADSDHDDLVVEPDLGDLAGPARVDCGLAGTVLRFVPPVAGLVRGRVEFVGDDRAAERPMAEMLSALRQLGVALDGEATALPFTVDGLGSVRGGVVTLDASASSQFVSGLLLAGARYEDGVDVRHDGKPIPSQPHIDMTVAMLRERGMIVDDSEPNRWVVAAGPVKPLDVVVEPDLSNAAPFAAAAVVSGGRVTVPGWPLSTTQAGDAVRWLLGEFGADVTLSDAGLTICGGDPGPGQQPGAAPARSTAGRIAGVDVDLHDVGELTPVVASLAALADGPSRLRGIAHLRGHETDRLAALATELRRCGSDCRETADGLEIRPGRLHAAALRSYGDHRMVHAAAVLGLRVNGLSVDDAAVTTKTHPDFVAAWSAMLT